MKQTIVVYAWSGQFNIGKWAFMIACYTTNSALCDVFFSLYLFFCYINDDPFHRRHFIFPCTDIYSYIRCIQILIVNVYSNECKFCALTVSTFFPPFKLTDRKKERIKKTTFIYTSNTHAMSEEKKQSKSQNKTAQIIVWRELSSIFPSVSYVIIRPHDEKLLWLFKWNIDNFLCVAKFVGKMR